MGIADLVRKMADAGATPEVIALAVEALEAEQAVNAARRAKRAEQKRNERARTATVARQSGDNAATVAALVPPEVPPKDNNQTPLLPSSGESAGRAREPDFRAEADEFYAAYPKKVNPSDAKKTFVKVVRAGGDPGQIIAAAMAYATAHRLAGTEKQFIPAPSVWLNRGGHLSEDLPQPRAGPPNVVPMNRRPDPSVSLHAALRNRLESYRKRDEPDLSGEDGDGVRNDPVWLLPASGGGRSGDLP